MGVVGHGIQKRAVGMGEHDFRRIYFIHITTDSVCTVFQSIVRQKFQVGRTLAGS